MDADSAASSSGREVSGEGPMISRPDSPAADTRRLHKIGWRSVSTGKLWIVPPGHMPAEYDVGPEWEPIYVLA